MHFLVLNFYVLKANRVNEDEELWIYVVLPRDLPLPRRQINWRHLSI